MSQVPAFSRTHPPYVLIFCLLVFIGCVGDPSNTQTADVDASSTPDSEIMGTDGTPPVDDVSMEDAYVRDAVPMEADQGCPPGINGTEELCDGCDNDADGEIDEGVRRRCWDGPAGSQGRGACRDGEQACTAGVWGECEESVLPQPESCDDVDEDCDGRVDEDIFEACGEAPNEGIGQCRAGRKTCVAGVFGECDAL